MLASLNEARRIDPDYATDQHAPGHGANTRVRAFSDPLSYPDAVDVDVGRGGGRWFSGSLAQLAMLVLAVLLQPLLERIREGAVASDVVFQGVRGCGADLRWGVWHRERAACELEHR